MVPLCIFFARAGCFFLVLVELELGRYFFARLGKEMLLSLMVISLLDRRWNR